MPSFNRISDLKHLREYACRKPLRLLKTLWEIATSPLSIKDAAS